MAYQTGQPKAWTMAGRSAPQEQDSKPMFSLTVTLPLGTGITEHNFKLQRQIEGEKQRNVTFIEQKTGTIITYKENERKDSFHFKVSHRTDEDKMKQGFVLIQSLCHSVCRKYKAFMEKIYAAEPGTQSLLQTVVGQVAQKGCANGQPHCKLCQLTFVSEGEKQLHNKSVMHRYMGACFQAKKPKPTLAALKQTAQSQSPPPPPPQPPMQGGGSANYDSVQQADFMKRLAKFNPNSESNLASNNQSVAGGFRGGNEQATQRSSQNMGQQMQPYGGRGNMDSGSAAQGPHNYQQQMQKSAGDPDEVSKKKKVPTATLR